MQQKCTALCSEPACCTQTSAHIHEGKEIGMHSVGEILQKILRFSMFSLSARRKSERKEKYRERNWSSTSQSRVAFVVDNDDDDCAEKCMLQRITLWRDLLHSHFDYNFLTMFEFLFYFIADFLTCMIGKQFSTINYNLKFRNNVYWKEQKISQKFFLTLNF